MINYLNSKKKKKEINKIIKEILLLGLIFIIKLFKNNRPKKYK